MGGLLPTKIFICRILFPTKYSIFNIYVGYCFLHVFCILLLPTLLIVFVLYHTNVILSSKIFNIFYKKVLDKFVIIWYNIKDQKE